MMRPGNTYTFADEVIRQIRREYVHGQRGAHLIPVHLTTRIVNARPMRYHDTKGLTVIVAITPSAILSDAPIVSTASNNGSLSSCRSLLYVDGRPLSVIKNPAILETRCQRRARVCERETTRTLPKMRPDLPLNNSNESGFFFCGMMLDPVLHARRQLDTKTRCSPHAPIRIAQRDEPKLGRRVHDQIFRQPTHVRHRQTGPHQKLDDKVAIADAPHTVLGQGRKTKFAGKEFAVDGKGVASEGTAAEREDRDARDELA